MLRLAGVFLLTISLLAVCAAGGAIYVFYHYGRALPDYKQLANYEPPVVTRVHAGDGRLLAEYAREKRVFVPVSAIPKRVIHAFLSAEDKNFYDHPGVDFFSVFRAAVTNFIRMGSDRRPIGGSTITQQVAKNFLLTNELSITRKIKEAILAFRIERAFSKDRILELYLNEIYLGLGSYGVAAAALNYFDKPLDRLTLAETAFLAGLPKAPNNYHPIRHAAAAKARRDYVIRRMLEDGYVTEAEAKAALDSPLVVRRPPELELTRAAYFAEEVRRALIDRFGEKRLYGGGLSVRTSLDPRLQDIASRTLRAGLIAYDRRHGWRGPLTHFRLDHSWPSLLAGLPETRGLGHWRRAVVLELDAHEARIGFEDGSQGAIPLAELAWARTAEKEGRRGPKVRRPADVLSPGDVVAVSPREGKEARPGQYRLDQIPEVSGAVVALDPHTGRVLAMSGGFDHELSQFNRAVQAMRQPGSAFKPFVYLAALENGFTPSSLILDAPFVIDQGPGLGKWKPANYGRKFYGPSPMRIGIEKSRNLMTVRLAQFIGIDKVADYAHRFGVIDDMPRMLSMALGSGETTLLRLTAAYAMLVNGGKRITPSLIDRVQDRNGRTVFRHDARDCPRCTGVSWHHQLPPVLPDNRKQIADPRSAYQIVSMLQGVVQRGTGRRIRVLKRPLAGKTGTTNDSQDAWFVGFSPDLAVGVFVGFDTPRTLGRGETGSSVAVPIFRDFMGEALKNKPAVPFRIPPGIRLVRVSASTGRLARPGDRDVILEAFKPGNAPVSGGAPASATRRVLDGSDSGGGAPESATPVGVTRGLY